MLADTYVVSKTVTFLDYFTYLATIGQDTLAKR